MEHSEFEEQWMVFAGDSGNDLDVLCSGLKTILVRNASAEVRHAAQQNIKKRGCTQQLYCARGGFMEMNGNYAAGVLEGVAFHLPELGDWLVRERFR